MRFRQAEAVTAATAAVTVVVLAKTPFDEAIFGALGANAPLGYIAAGALIAVVLDGQGTAGNVFEGIGYGLVAYGALAWASAR